VSVGELQPMQLTMSPTVEASLPAVIDTVRSLVQSHG
jgi:hypothetical protein